MSDLVLTNTAPTTSRPALGRASEAELPDAALFWRWAAGAVRPWAAWILVAAGVIAIIVGWYGVSGQALVAKQLPYLISGGLLGVALVGIGAAMLSAERRRQDAGRIERLEEMVADLRAVLLAEPEASSRLDLLAYPEVSSASGSELSRGSRAATAARSDNGSAAAGNQVVAIPTGTTFHSPGCQMVRGKDGVAPVNQRAISERGLSPCRICEPELSRA